MDIKKKTELIKKKCKELFDNCGITDAQILEKEAKRLKEWLDNNFHDQMNYMENHFEKRINPQKLVENTKTVIVVLLNYYPEKPLSASSKYLISKYAYGKDYHFVMKKKLWELANYINSHIENIEYRAFVDSAPVLEKALAQKAGLGWIGKNSLLITKKGSYFFIGELFINIELEYDKPHIKNYCGACQRCIEACPTEAIIKPYVIDSRKCISNLTIERKPPIPNHFKGKYKQWIFGCDICQDVCPWNNKAQASKEEDFKPLQLLYELTAEDWENLTKETFNKLFKKSAVKRRKYEGLKHNIEFLKN